MKRFFTFVLLTTVVAGTLDILSAYVHYFIKTNKVSTGMFHYIAGGALGLGTSMKGGFEVAALGVFFHYFIAFAFTLFHFLMYPKLPVLSSNKYLSGLVYGLFVWAVMNFLVLPLSMLPQHAFSWNDAIIAALILMFLVGLPISIGAHNYHRHMRVEKKD